MIIDPIGACLGKGVDSHRDTAVRQVLAPLGQLAARHEVTVLVIAHLNKNESGSAIHRTNGSIAFVAAARHVWLIHEDAEDRNRRLMVSVKCNIAAEATGLAFRIHDSGCGPVIAWEDEPVSIPADDLLRSAAAAADDRPEIIRAIQNSLSDGPKSFETITEDVEQACGHVGEKRLRGTLSSVAETYKDGQGGWFWRLKDSST